MTSCSTGPTFYFFFDAGKLVHVQLQQQGSNFHVKCPSDVRNQQSFGPGLISCPDSRSRLGFMFQWGFCHLQSERRSKSVSRKEA